mgnify:FL=1
MEDKIFDIVTDLIREDITKDEAIDKLLVLYSVINWVAFDWMKIETRPTKYGKYLITRKDGKIHWETWNGSGWAYNGNVITYWMEVKPPCSQR